MGTQHTDLETPVTGLDDLLAPFHAAEKPRSAFAIGTEAEKPGVRSDGRPIPYEGEGGVRVVLERLVERFGWTPESEYEGGPLLALKRGLVTLDE